MDFDVDPRCCILILLTVPFICFYSYLEELGRHNYVTPTSYLELISSFKGLLNKKQDEVRNAVVVLIAHHFYLYNRTGKNFYVKDICKRLFFRILHFSYSFSNNLAWLQCIQLLPLYFFRKSKLQK